MLLDLLSGKERAPAECVIEVDGRPLVDLYPYLVEASVETHRSEPATATLVFETRRDERGEWSVQDAFGLDPRTPLLAEWKPVTIKAAFGLREEEVLRGFIRQLRSEYPADAGAARLTVECQDESLQLDREHVRKTWGSEQRPASDRAILSELLGPYAPLSPDPQCASGQNGLTNLNQDGTDIQFIKARAEANGYELLFRRGTVYFGPMRLQGLPQPTLMVYAGADTNCLSLSVTSDAHQPDAVRYEVPAVSGTAARSDTVSPDLPVLGRVRADSVGSGLRPFVWTLSAQSGADEPRVRDLAQRKANEFDMLKVQGEGELDGTLYGHVLLAGAPVAVDGLGSRLSGTYYVDSVSHVFNAQGYRQRFRLLRNAYGDNLDSVAPIGAVLAAIF